MRFLFIISIFFALQNVGLTQIQTNSNEDNQTEVDSASSQIVENQFFDIFYGKPGKAAFYGLVIPGGGQIYNKKWWKLPLVYGLEGFLVFRIINSGRNYRGFQRAYLNNLVEGNPTMCFRGITNTQSLLANRDRFRKQNEFSYVIFLGGHILTIFEAFIDRHLMEFDISDDLTIQSQPSAVGPVTGFTLTIPLNKAKSKPFIRP